MEKRKKKNEEIHVLKKKKELPMRSSSLTGGLN